MLDKQQIVEQALKLGFDQVKFASIKNLEQETENFKVWINNGYHADMNWIKKHVDLRYNPRNIVESAQSIIVLAHSYNKGYENIETEGYGKIARYAVGRDYHKVLKKKLSSLDRFIASKYKIYESRYFVDSGPVAERDWAVISGLGARGKNSLILNKKLGSYFFISTIITNLDFKPDQPIKDMCGKCTKCISACPTSAIEKPYVVNSNKCISYWTIESKSEKFPEQIKSNLNSWIFGCDICQQVCPWNNHRIKITDELDFYPQKFLPQENLDQIIKMSEDTFLQRFSGSPVMRTKLTGLKRNAQSVLKSQGDDNKGNSE